MRKTEDGSIFVEQDEYEHLLEAFAKQQKEEFYAAHPEGVSGPSISLYEINQQLIQKLPNADESAIEAAETDITNWLIDNPDKYYMLLCNDERYYTLFHCKDGASPRATAVALIDLLKEFAFIKVIEKDTNGALAIWGALAPATDNVAPICFYFFPYGRGVIEIE